MTISPDGYRNQFIGYCRADGVDRPLLPSQCLVFGFTTYGHVKDLKLMLKARWRRAHEEARAG